MNLIIFVVCITITIFIYKQIRKNSLAKGRGKLRACATSGVITFMAFIFLLGIGSHFGPKPDSTTAAKENGPSATANSSFAELTDSSDDVTTFDLSHPYEKAEYDFIRSLPNPQRSLNMSNDESMALTVRDGRMLIFREFGMNEDDFTHLVLPTCSVELNRLNASYRNETSLWLPLKNENYVVEAERERRKEWNKQHSEKLDRAYKRMKDCMYTLSQQQPMHIPRKPEIE
ncbi:hypothetical protein [Erwinia billingiae]|uniref:hypothetical protein n=1 Tax=Erwinia billingiae TaxID=182337 RepID=UPI000CFFB106|nr:hypothetical protein [Erwinia billingiae]PRB60480.1 hypothetical protein CQ001_10045 [Erwinia billingiae]